MQNASDYYSDTFGERPHFHNVVFFATDFHTEQDFKNASRNQHFLTFLCHISCPRIQFPHIWQWNISQANDDNDGPAK